MNTPKSIIHMPQVCSRNSKPVNRRESEDFYTYLWLRKRNLTPYYAGKFAKKSAETEKGKVALRCVPSGTKGGWRNA